MRHHRPARHRLAFRLAAASLLILLAGSATTTTHAQPPLSPEWSDPATAITANNAQTFHGPFRAQPVTLALKRLPPHRWLKINFDLLILGSWDGSNRVWGPDLWSLTVRGGQRLVFTSFSNAGVFINNDEQAFPDDYPTAIHPAWTGAAQKYRSGELYKNPFAPAAGTIPDSVYHLEIVCPHQDATASLDFSALNNDPDAEEVWGLANVVVSVVTTDPTPTSALPALWADLSSRDSTRADAALWQCVGAGSATLDFFVVHLPALQTAMRDALRQRDPAVLAPLGQQLHRMHKIARIIGGPQSSDLCWQLEHLFPEYAGIFPEQYPSMRPAARAAAPAPASSSVLDKLLSK